MLHFASFAALDRSGLSSSERMRLSLKRVLTRACASACLCLVIGLAGAADSSRTLDRIKSDGVIRLGYRSGGAPFSSVRGYSAELCTRVGDRVRVLGAQLELVQ